MSGYTQEQVDALRAMIARGGIEYQFGNERIRFESLSAARRQLAIMEAAVSGTSSAQVYPKFVARPQ